MGYNFILIYEYICDILIIVMKGDLFVMSRKKLPTAKRIRQVNRRNRMVFFCIITLFIIILVAGLLYILWIYRQADDVKATYEQIVEEVEDYPDLDEKNSEIDKWLLRKIKFNSLTEINSDVKTWVFIPHTIIDYPVLQEQKLNEYFYLHHDIYKSYNSIGSVFTPKEPDNMDDAHMLLFAHRFFYTNAMFSHLRDYASEKYYKKHKYVYMYYPDHSERWQVFAVTDTNEDDSVYDIPYTIGSDDYKQLIEHIYDKSLYQTGVICDELTRIITLSTCRGNVYGGPYRFTVNCVKDCEYYYKDKRLVKKEYLPKEMIDVPPDEDSGNVYDDTTNDDTDPAIKAWIEDIKKNGR